MLKQVPQTELDAVLQVVARYPGGLSIEELGGALETKLPRRTLQRRLALLVEQNLLAIEGRGRGSRYRLPAKEIEVQPLPAVWRVTPIRCSKRSACWSWGKQPKARMRWQHR